MTFTWEDNVINEISHKVVHALEQEIAESVIYVKKGIFIGKWL